MARDYRKLKVFALADDLVGDVYEATRRFPPEERIGLQAQLRHSAVAVPSNIVVGTERSSDSESAHYHGIALSSAAEARYLLRLAARLGYLPEERSREIEDRYDKLVGGLKKLIVAVREGKRRSNGGAGSAQRKWEPRPGGGEDPFSADGGDDGRR